MHRGDRGVSTWAWATALGVWALSGVAHAQEAVAEVPGGFAASLDAFFGEWIVGPLASVLFFDLWFWDGVGEGIQVPFIVLWLILGASYFTLRMGFISIRGFGHAIAVTRGVYDNPDEEGEVSHFQALSSALSATVGLGNIAGVAVAVTTGGPGAVFWMVVAGFLGMSSKFTECTLGMMYRKHDAKGQMSGGPMRYLELGLEDIGGKNSALAILGKGLAVLFAVMCIGGSLGGGNMFQANQAFAQTARVIPWFADQSWLFGLILAAIVGVVILGGIRRIGQVAGFVVPIMCVVYVVAGIFVLVVNAAQIPHAFGVIFESALTPEAGFGGFIGTLMTGFQRAAFSNEAGVGSASIAHSAATTSEPVREGIVALLEPFIDTIVVCTFTGLVVVVTGVYAGEGASGADGVLLTSDAFATVLPWFPYVLAFTVFLFAFSTMISWSYYGERCWTLLFGVKSSMIYKVMFLCFVVFGAVLPLGNVIGFSDLMVLGMAFPNIFGAVLLSGRVKAALDSYWTRLKRGDMKPPDPSVRGKKKPAPKSDGAKDEVASAKS